MECEKWNLLGWGYSIVPGQTKATSPCPLTVMRALSMIGVMWAASMFNGKCEMRNEKYSFYSNTAGKPIQGKATARKNGDPQRDREIV